MSLKVYYDLMSQPSRALVILLQATNIPFEHCPVALRKGEHLTEKFKDINRFQKVPCIVDNGFKLAETIAIVRYIAREKSIADHYYPNDSKKQAKVDEFLEWQHISLRSPCASFFLQTWLFPKLSGKQLGSSRAERLKLDMDASLDKMENLWLSSGLYVAGDKISVADIIAACEIEQPRMAGYDPTEGRPKLAAWLKRVRQELSPYYEDAHKVVNKVAQQTKQDEGRSKL